MGVPQRVVFGSNQVHLPIVFTKTEFWEMLPHFTSISFGTDNICLGPFSGCLPSICEGNPNGAGNFAHLTRLMSIYDLTIFIFNVPHHNIHTLCCPTSTTFGRSHVKFRCVFSLRR